MCHGITEINMTGPSGAWGKPLVVREQTPEERQRAIDGARERQLAEQTRALNSSAMSLAGKVESEIASRDGGASGNYVGDEQYSVSGSYDGPVILLAFEKWKAKYSSSDVVDLQMHMLGPSPKYTGGRNGQKQANFIRKIGSASPYRFNIHIDAA
ncbi:MAG: hypothetical protein ACI89U_001530 [Gammaproteobacteria bacterium]|jgi:hypothetical protein